MPSPSGSKFSQTGWPQPQPQLGVWVAHIAYVVTIGIKLLGIGNGRAVIAAS